METQVTIGNAAAKEPPRLRGRLLSLRNSDRGYAFLSVGTGKPEYFILRSQVPASAWIKGQEFEFTPMPPRIGTHNQRAGFPVPVESAQREEQPQ